MIQTLSIFGFAALACYLLVRVAMSATVTNRKPASFIFWLCFVSAVLALFASAFWLTSAVRNSEAFAAMAYLMGVVPVLGGGTLLFCVVPSAVLYVRGRQQSDLVSLWISGASVAVITLEALLLLPLRGH